MLLFSSSQQKGTASVLDPISHQNYQQALKQLNESLVQGNPHARNSVRVYETVELCFQIHMICNILHRYRKEMKRKFHKIACYIKQSK